MSRFWHEDWDGARQRLTDWWHRKGCALFVTAPKDEPWADVSEPKAPERLEDRWTDPAYRTARDVRRLSRTYFGGAAFPYVDTVIGPGSLGLFLGNDPGFAPDTVWYEPADPSSLDKLGGPEVPTRREIEGNRWFQVHLAFVEEALRVADGRFLVGMPDLIENLDTLAQLVGPEPLMYDLIERPAWVQRSIEQINFAYFEAFDAIYDRIRTPWGGNAFAAFGLWGPGKTAKVQCDAFAMISPAMAREFVLPSLTEQCEWLDYSMFHLDGTQAMGHLEQLLAIEDLDAIEWTPQAGIESGGNPRWYDLYRGILGAGKSVQAIGVEAHEVLPLLDACGHEGMFVMATAPDEKTARALVQKVYG
ncbi:MAG TPA: hypothetical protein VGE01_11610 [Fimbriimonas sp.]